jgi:NADPH:quinone reductase-like Zn-dependent oxidoreductase
MLNPLDVIFKLISLRGFHMGHPKFAAKIPVASKQAAAMIAAGEMKVPIAATYPLSSIKEAVTHALRGGKVLLKVGK